MSRAAASVPATAAPAVPTTDSTVATAASVPAGSKPAARPLLRLAVLGGSRAAAAGLGFAAVLILAPRVEPALLGQWSMLLAIQGYALHVSEAGLRSVVTAESGRTHGGAKALLPVYLGLRLTLASIVALSLTGLALLFTPDQALPLALVLTSLIAIALQLDWLALVDDRPMLAGLLLLVRPAAWCLLLLSAEAFTLPLLAALFALAWAASALASWPQLVLEGLPARSASEPPLPVRRLLALGVPVGLVTLSNQALHGADLLLVGWAFGPASAGHYYLASSIVVAGLVFANAMNQIALAELGGSTNEPEQFQARLRRELRRVAVLGLAIGAVTALLAPLLLPHLLGPSYGETVPLLLLLVPWLVLQHPTALLQGALVAARDQRALLTANLVMLAAHALLLAAAVTTGSLALCALARSGAELVRLALLARTAGLTGRA